MRHSCNEKAQFKNVWYVRFIYGAQYGPNFNREAHITKSSQVEQLLLDIKADDREFDERFEKYCSTWVNHKILEIHFFSKRLLHQSYPHKWRLCFVLTFPQNGNPQELFVHDVSLRSLMSLFDWGHLFVK